MASRNTRSRLPAANPPNEPREREHLRLAVRRVRLRPLVRVGFGFGWIASIVPAFLFSIILVWVLHGIWATLDGWTPWTPWSPDTRILGAQLPTPEFRPREALGLNGLYRALTPIGRHPFLGAALLTLALTFCGEIGITLGLLVVGLAYNRFAWLTGGIELEVVERPTPRGAARSRGANRAARGGDDPRDDWDEAELRW